MNTNIDTISKDEFIDVAKSIIKGDKFIGGRNLDKLEADTSFREVLDITSLDIAELVISLEEKYRVDMDWANTNAIDNLNDIYTVFSTSIKKAKHSVKAKMLAPIKQKKPTVKHTQQEINNAVKEIILERYTHLSEKEVTKDASLRWDLKFDSLDRLEILMDFEKKFNVSIEDVSEIESANSLQEYCFVLYQKVNPDIIPETLNIETKEDVFEVLKKYLLDNYEIMNARMSDNLFKDLHFSEIDRTDLCTWAEEKFNIELPYTYFINIDDFCEKVLYVLQRKNFKANRPPLLTRMKQRFIQRSK